MSGHWIRWLIRAILILAIAVTALISAVPEIVPETSRADIVRAMTFIVIFAGLAQLLPFVWNLPIGKSGTAQTEPNRAALIRIVRRNWINGDGERPGVLEDALRDAQFNIDIKTAPEKVDQSQGYKANTLIKPAVTVRRGDRTPLPIDSTPDALAKAFYDNDKQLLILGDPGSGKTVLLLQLAQRLLDDAAADKMKAVPVVISLSSWAIKRQRIEEWIVDELQRVGYGVSKNQAKEWVNTDSLVYLLDGLDEVAEDHRADCLTALNAFITPERQVVVCSRSEEYAALTRQLNVHNAVEVQPFQPGQFEAYLRQFIPYQETVDSLLQALRADADVWAEVQKPLFVNILISTYRDGKTFDVASAQGDTLARVRLQVIEPYVTRQLQNVANAPLSNANMRRYLGWLGWEMQRQDLATFYVEEIQREWLSTSVGRKLFAPLLFVLGTLFSILILLLFGVRSALALSGAGTLAGGLAAAFASLVNKTDSRARPTMNINKLRSAFTGESALKIGRTWRIVFGVTMILSFTLSLRETLLGIVIGLVSGILFSQFIFIWLADMFARLFGGTLAMFFEEWTIRESRVPNEGFRHALASGILAPLVIYGFYQILNGIFDAAERLLGSTRSTLDFQFLVPIGVWAISLLFGLSMVFNHIVLRVLLYREGSVPLRFDKLLYHARDRRLMRQVGGGFIFIHRYVLEYFAAYWEEHYLQK